MEFAVKINDKTSKSQDNAKASENTTTKRQRTTLQEHVLSLLYDKGAFVVKIIRP